MAVKELKRLASEEHEEYKKQVAKKRQQQRDYNVKAKAFGWQIDEDEGDDDR